MSTKSQNKYTFRTQVFHCRINFAHLMDVDAFPITSLVIEKLFTDSVDLSRDKDKVFIFSWNKLKGCNYID